MPTTNKETKKSMKSSTHTPQTSTSTANEGIVVLPRTDSSNINRAQLMPTSSYEKYITLLALAKGAK